jgi:hypothetical protein
MSPPPVLKVGSSGNKTIFNIFAMGLLLIKLETRRNFMQHYLYYLEVLNKKFGILYLYLLC